MSEGQRVIEWRPFDPAEFPDPAWSDYYVGKFFMLPVGYIARDKDGTIWMVGDMTPGGNTEGCGCCSDDVDIVEIADMLGDIEGFDR